MHRANDVDSGFDREQDGTDEKQPISRGRRAGEEEERASDDETDRGAEVDESADNLIPPSGRNVSRG